MEAKTIPAFPFGTADFGAKPGGLDFLGLRIVNLRMLARDLLPGINNATSDVGSFMLGTWLPWKFESIAGKSHFNTTAFDCFNEAVQISISHCQRHGSPAEQKFGSARTRIGVEQEINFPTELRFGNVGRTPATSVFAAPLYGPSLRSLGLHRGYAQAENGRLTDINMASETAATATIARYVDRNLSASPAYQTLLRLEPTALAEAEIDDLGLHGLHPAHYRTMPKDIQKAFATFLLPATEGEASNGRTLTAALLIETLSQSPGLTAEQVRRTWHTGHLGTKKLELADARLVLQRELWSLFMTRQYQRFCLELMMHCFERCLRLGARSVRDCVASMLGDLGVPHPTFRSLLEAEALGAGGRGSTTTISSNWNATIHGSSSNYDEGDDLDPDNPANRAFHMLARWHLRTYSRISNWKHLDQVNWDGPDRISVRWFSEWIENRADLALDRFLEDFLTQFVFTQHLRVAMGRYDGREVQRLRFSLDDNGIVRTDALKNSPPLEPGWMADRLLAFVALLSDLGVVRDEAEHLCVGPNADLVPRL